MILVQSASWFLSALLLPLLQSTTTNAFLPHHIARSLLPNLPPPTTSIVTIAPRKTTTTSLAGGGFGSSPSSSSSTKKNKKKDKKNKKRGGRLVADTPPPPPPPPATETQNEVKLDRFGLPVQTIDDLFPPLPAGTELIGMVDDGEGGTKMSEVRAAMERHIPLNYDLFDEDGVEKEELCGCGSGGEKRVPWKLKMMHRSPPVICIEDFFSPEECQEYIDITNPPPQQTTTSTNPLKVNSATFSTLAQSKRTSTTWFCHFSQVPALLAKSKRLLGPHFPLERMEETQIVRYRTGEEFSWHYDEVPDPSSANGGQRVGTLLVYLTTVEEGRGGGTVFRDLKPPSSSTSGGGKEHLTMQPRQGSAMIFFPALEDGTPDDRTLHKGEVAIDEKMIAQMWLHEREYEPVVPEGNSHDGAREVLERKELDLGFL